jgi:NAD+ diphosphatase
MGAHAVAAIASADAPLLFLGVDAAGHARFAIELADAAPLEEAGRFDDLRAVGPRLDPGDLAAIGCAKSIFDWHARHGFCAKCGHPTKSVEAGWKRECAICKSEHFPRVDPVVIMLPTFEERCLLGRQARWPRGMQSALAGFVEPGETIEEAVARETLEEAGLTVSEVRMHSTQPWPFPSSLMIGAICAVANDALTLDPQELESAHWFSRADALLLLRGEHPEYFAPPAFAIAHQLLKTWVEV